MSKGLMIPTPKPDMMADLRKAFGPSSTAPQSLEQKLKSLQESELQLVLRMAQMVKLAHGFTRNNTEQYISLVSRMYPRLNSNLRSLVAEILEDAQPVPAAEPVVMTTKDDPREKVLSEYESNLSMQPTADDRVAAALQSAMADTLSAEAEKQTDTPPAPNNRSLVERPSSSFEGKDDFLARMTPVAKEVAADLGISHKIVLAQAALESGWGKSVRSNNLMGIKSHGKAGGADVVTHEVIDGERVKITDSFRQYDTPEDSIRGYGQFLKENHRYKQFLEAGASGNENTQLSALQSSGYATDPKYAQKLAAIIKGIPDEDGE